MNVIINSKQLKKSMSQKIDTHIKIICSSGSVYKHDTLIQKLFSQQFEKKKKCSLFNLQNFFFFGSRFKMKMYNFVIIR